MKPLLALAAVLLLAGCEQAQVVHRAAYCHLYPSKCPAVTQPSPPVAPSVERVPEPRPKAVKPKPVLKPKPAVRRAPIPPRAEGGPDLPYPCWLVRLHAAGKSPAQLDAMAKQHGVKLTPKQERQARACLTKGN